MLVVTMGRPRKAAAPRTIDGVALGFMVMIATELANLLDRPEYKDWRTLRVSCTHPRLVKLHDVDVDIVHLPDRIRWRVLEIHRLWFPEEAMESNYDLWPTPFEVVGYAFPPYVVSPILAK